MLRLVAILVVIAFTVYTFVDCAQTREGEARSLPKGVWLAVILLVPVLGGAGWLLAGRSAGPPAPPSRRRQRPRGPDDDPDFLDTL